MTQNLSKPEPAPQPNSNAHLWSLVIRDMLDRNEAGVKKYGTALQAGNGRDALMDAYQEALDLCVYLRQAIEERPVVSQSLTAEPWQSAIPEQDVQRREQVATAGYIIPQMEDGDDDPAVVPEVVCTACEHHFFSDSENGARILKTGLCFACCKNFGVDPPVRMPPETVLPLKPLPDECLGALCGRVRG